ncbi:MAG: cytochrome bc complex cytochrome b subunit [Candidatus Omnitrophica bacterium]|nr:cytochrome bc complex cytochrome b subunit [Candidatus Omnitrophota bacterium]
MKHRLKQWFAERFDLEQLKGPVQKQLHKPLPKNISWAHTLGSMSLFLFVSQVLTGILLLIYYRPTVNEAFESVKFIMTKSYMGWLYRQIHAWGANLMLIVVFLHMLRTFITGSYKKPRELTWVFGVFLFLLTLVFGFTGYLLPWNQLAYWATTVGTEVAGAIPVLGEWIKTFLRGGFNVGGETLSRFFVVHVIILPWVLFFIVLIHLVLVRIQGIATMDPVGSEKETKPGEGTPFFPNHVLKEGVVFFILLGILITLSILTPFDLGEKADPLTTPLAIKPEWYFLPMYQVIKYFPKLVGIFVVGIGPLFLLAWPLLDKSSNRHPLHRPISMTIGILALLSLLILGTMGYFSESKRHFFGKEYDIDIYGIPHLVSSNANRRPSLFEAEKNKAPAVP